MRPNADVWRNIEDLLSLMVPLKPYLELERLQQVGYLANEQRVLSFLEQYEGTPLDWQLRRPWLTYLASQGEEQRFIRDFRHPGTLTHRCQLIAAERNQGLADAPFIKKVDAIWKHGFFGTNGL